jgi:hypothetical protein
MCRYGRSVKQHRPHGNKSTEYGCSSTNRWEIVCHGPESLCSVDHCSSSCGLSVQIWCGQPQAAKPQLTDPISPTWSYRTNRLHTPEEPCSYSQQRHSCGSLRACEHESDQDTAPIS